MPKYILDEEIAWPFAFVIQNIMRFNKKYHIRTKTTLLQKVFKGECNK